MRALARGLRLKEAEGGTRSDWGLDDSLMTEHAARSALEAILAWKADWGRGLVALCGRGGNGGDGLALAALAARRGLPVLACILAPGPLGQQAALRLAMVRKASIPVIEWTEGSAAALRALGEAGILLDALAGIGLSGPLRAEYQSLCQAWNASAPPKVALDLPSGLREGWKRGEALFRADLCVSLGLFSLPLFLPEARPLCGELRVVSGGIFPEELLKPLSTDPLLLDEGDFSLPPLSPDATKIERGRLWVFAGSVDGAGAALLASRAAARAGAGLVDLVVDEVLWTALAPAAGGIRLRPLPAGEAWRALRFDGQCVLAGPGWGRGEDRKALLKGIAKAASGLVLDADALNLLAEEAFPLPAASILSPQENEGARLLGISAEELRTDPAAAASSIALRYGATTILKGPITWIAGPDGTLAAWEGRMGELGTGGSGDVLAGIAAGLLSRGLPPPEAARQAVILHARAAKLAKAERGSFLAEELCERLSRCLPAGGEDQHG